MLFNEYNLIAPAMDEDGRVLIAYGFKNEKGDYAVNIVYDSEGNVVDAMLQVNEDVIVYGRRRKQAEQDNTQAALD